jgi:branched-chain amino acid transport system substrate-binding protein
MSVSRHLLLAAIALLLAGCDGGKPKVLTIGVLVAQTGSSGLRGKDLLNGATLAAEEINASGFKASGKLLTIEIKAADDRGDVDAARTATTAFLDADVNALIGPLNSNQATEVIPLVAAKGIPEMITATSASLVGLGQGNVLRLLANDEQQGRAIASFATENLQARRIGILAERSDYGRGLSTTVVAALAKLHLEPAISAEIDDKKPVTPQTIASFRAANVDTILFLAREPQLVGLLDVLENTGWLDLTIVGTNVIRNQNVAHRPVRVNALYATATAIDAKEFPEGKIFLASFQRRFGSDPVWGAQYAYDAVYALADAVRESRSLDGPTLVKTLKQIEPATKVNQQMRFAASGEQVYPNIAVYKVDQSAWILQMMSATW